MSAKKLYSLGLLLIISLLGVSFYLQFFDGVLPCPLCTLQRFTFVLLGLILVVGLMLHKNRIGRFIINFLLILVSLAGILLASRQIWLQRFPNENAGECGVSLQYMLEVLPLNQVAQKIFEGSSECAQKGWEFLSLNMAEWALIGFLIYLFMSLYLIFKVR